MTMAIRQRFSIGGKKFRARILRVHIDEHFQQLKNIGMQKIIWNTMSDEQKESLSGEGVTQDMDRYYVAMILNRRQLVAHVFAHDELGAITRVLRILRSNVAELNGLNRFNRPK